MRGERDWRDLFDLAEQLGQGSRYQSARLCDPQIVEALVKMPESDGNPPIEGWDGYTSRLANIEDLLMQLMYVSCQADPSQAPRTPRPRYPHELRRLEIKHAKKSRITGVLIPGEEV